MRSIYYGVYTTHYIPSTIYYYWLLLRTALKLQSFTEPKAVKHFLRPAIDVIDEALEVHDKYGWQEFKGQLPVSIQQGLSLRACVPVYNLFAHKILQRIFYGIATGCLETHRAETL